MSDETYKAAERSINEALRLQRNSLELRGLATLPPEIGQLTGLENLYLTDGQLVDLPPEIGQLTALRQLVLYRNRLTVLPPEIGRLTALEYLVLSENQLTALPPEIGRLSCLRKLEIIDNNLTALPHEIGQLAALDVLHLSENQITSLPPEIGQLTTLSRLFLDRYKLSALPPEIGQLRALSALVLTDNQLTALPREIGQLTALASDASGLVLGGNPLPYPYPALTELGTKFVLLWLRGQLNLDALSRAVRVRTQGEAGALPVPVPGVISPVDFTVSAGNPIRAKPSADVQPVFKTPADKRDHKPRLGLCRATAVGLIHIIEQRRFNLRDGYRQVLTDYVKHLPTTIKTRNLLFADQEARVLRDLFAADADSLPPEFASRLRALLQAHIALRVFYPGIERFYDDVRFGRTGDPLPIDAVEALTTILADAPKVFDASVGQALSDAAPSQALSDAAPSFPLRSESVPHEHETAALRPPDDPLGTLSTEKAQAYARASIINRLWTVFLRGEALNKNADAWIAIGTKLVPYARPILEWLADFKS
jgi:hypothetical protein